MQRRGGGGGGDPAVAPGAAELRGGAHAAGRHLASPTLGLRSGDGRYRSELKYHPPIAADPHRHRREQPIRSSGAGNGEQRRRLQAPASGSTEVETDRAPVATSDERERRMEQIPRNACGGGITRRGGTRWERRTESPPRPAAAGRARSEEGSEEVGTERRGAHEEEERGGSSSGWRGWREAGLKKSRGGGRKASARWFFGEGERERASEGIYCPLSFRVFDLLVRLRPEFKNSNLVVLSTVLFFHWGRKMV